MSLEIECKYLNVDFEEMRNNLRKVGAVGGQAHFESNLVFDTKDFSLMHTDRLLRLRTQEWADCSQHLLTLKMPSSGGDTAFKTRDELETPVNDATMMAGLFAGLGYEVVARYEKVREEWHFHNVEIVLDTLPFIHVVELEGMPDDIYAVEQALSLPPTARNTESYHALHMAWLRENNLPLEPSFVFEKGMRNDWRKQLGLTI